MNYRLGLSDQDYCISKTTFGVWFLHEGRSMTSRHVRYFIEVLKWFLTKAEIFVKNMDL